MKTIALMALALVAGGLVPVQGLFNVHLAKILNDPIQSSFISFLGALVFLSLALLILRTDLPSWQLLRSAPWYDYSGGLFGAIFVTVVLMLAPKIGMTNTLAATIAGQLIISVALDHFGAMNLPQQMVNLPRIAGCLGLMLSLYLIQKT
jgi:bacterial/archaeal transporter family-2 protein